MLALAVPVVRDFFALELAPSVDGSTALATSLVGAVAVIARLEPRPPVARDPAVS